MKLEIQRLRKEFGNQRAVFIDKLQVPDFQTIAVIGPSGSGKSTLLRLIAGLEYPNSGSIKVNEEFIVFKEKELLQYRKKLGVVFQSWNLFPHLTALENIILPLCKVQGFTRDEAQNRSMELLKRFQLDKHAHKRPHALSGGQIQRVALIRAVAGYPQILFLDEPTSALDPLMTAEVLELIMEIKKEGRDLFLVTHHHSFAKRIADWVLFMAEGRVIEQGSPLEIFDTPKDPLVNQFMATIHAYG